MELLLFFLLTFLLFLCIIRKYGKKARKYPPGPWKLPILGNLHHIAVGSLHRTMTDLARKHGPVMHMQLGEVSAIVISSPEAAKEVFKTHDLTFADRPRILFAKVTSYNFIDMAFSPYGDYWRQLRKICSLELLSSKRVRSYRSLREDEVRNLITSILSSPGVPVNLTDMVSSMTNNITSRAAFGSKCKDNDVFVAMVKEAARLATGFFVPDILPSFKFLHPITKAKIGSVEKIIANLFNIIDDVIDVHIAKRKSGMLGADKSDDDDEEDLVDVFLRLQESNQLELSIGRENIKAVILNIFSAGTETSASTVEWAMSEMVKNPRVMEKAQAEVRSSAKGKGNVDETDIQQMKYLRLVIKETLRLHPPLPLSVPREARENCKVSGYDIPEKTMVIVNIWAIGRSEGYWTNAECFEPERFEGSEIDFKGANFEYIPFGAGRRICPGISFGIASIELSLAQLLYHFDWKLPNGLKPEEFDMTEEPGFTMQRKNALKLIAIPYTY